MDEFVKGGDDTYVVRKQRQTFYFLQKYSSINDTSHSQILLPVFTIPFKEASLDGLSICKLKDGPI